MRPTAGCSRSTTILLNRVPPPPSTWVESIYARAQVLEEFPDLGYRYLSPSGRETRILMWGHYKIVYMRPKEHEVHIVGVFHGSMNLDQYLA